MCARIWLALIVTCLAQSPVLCQQSWNSWRAYGWNQPGHHDDTWSPWRPPWENYDNAVVVRTLYGDVRGFSVPWHIDDLDWDPAWEEHPPWYTRRVNCFLGIPYAMPPVGELRFKRPERPVWPASVKGWDATYFRPACPQRVDQLRLDIPEYPAVNISEDCLYMNIFAPNLTYYNNFTAGQYPVLVWFHSGDFLSGSAQTEPGHVLATREIVVVTFNYRLGALGYMTTQDEQAAGNWGLYDMQLALEFVKENIKKFQGDPDRITIGGDTAGASAVGFMMLSEMTRRKGFYHQCIMMSGTDLSRSAFLNPYWDPREYALELGAELGCVTSDTYRMMNCLRDNTTITWQKILDAQEKVKPRDGDLGVVWAPTQDGGWFQDDPNYPQVPFLRMPPIDSRLRESLELVPCIIGINTQDGVKKANESQPNLHRGMYREELREFIRQLLTDQNIQDMYLDRVTDAVEFQYTYWPDPENNTARQQQFIHLMTDIEVGLAMDRALKFAVGKAPQWMYQFNYNSWNNWLPNWMGVGFNQATRYVFGVPFMNETVLNETELEPRQFYDYDDRNMSAWMMYMWTNFIREGQPTPNITRNITWDPFNLNNLSYVIIDYHSHIWGRYRQDKYGFWGDYLHYIAKQEPFFMMPTPAGYEFVVATGFMSTLCIVLLAALALIAVALWYQNKQQQLAEEFPPPTRQACANRHPPSRQGTDFIYLSRRQRAPPGEKHGAMQQSPMRSASMESFTRQYVRSYSQSSGQSDDEYFVPQLYPTPSTQSMPPYPYTAAAQSKVRYPGANTVSDTSDQEFGKQIPRSMKLPPAQHGFGVQPYKPTGGRSHQSHSVV